MVKPPTSPNPPPRVPPHAAPRGAADFQLPAAASAAPRRQLVKQTPCFFFSQYIETLLSATFNTIFLIPQSGNLRKHYVKHPMIAQPRIFPRQNAALLLTFKIKNFTYKKIQKIAKRTPSNSVGKTPQNGPTVHIP